MRKLFIFILLATFSFVGNTQSISKELKDIIDSTLKEKIDPLMFEIKGVKEALENNAEKKDTITKIHISKKPIRVYYAAVVSKYKLKQHIKKITFSDKKRDLKKKYNIDSKNITLDKFKDKEELKNEEKKLAKNKQLDLDNLKLDWNSQKFRPRNFSDSFTSRDISFFNNEIKNKNFKLTMNSITKSPPEVTIERGLFRRKVRIKQEKSDTLKLVTLAISQDRIQDITVHINNYKPFFAGKAPIPFYTLKKSERNDMLFNKNGAYIFLSDIIDKYSPDDYKYQIYLDKTYSDIAPDSTIYLYTTKDINHFINYSIYSDLPSLVNDQSNGLIEMKFDGALIMNRKNLRNSYGYFFRELSANLKIAKINGELSVIENKQKELIINTDTTILASPRIMDIYQRSYIGGGFKANIFKGFFNVNNYWHCSIGAEYRAAKFRNIDSLSQNIGVFSLLAETGLYLKPFEAFGAILDVGYRYTDFKEIEGVSDQKFAAIGTFGINLFWTPNQKSKYFINIQYNTDWNSRDNFALFQFGYKADLTKMFKKE